jgi:hypothetical protein
MRCRPSCVRGWVCVCRFCSLDCHDELTDIGVETLLTGVFTNHRCATRRAACRVGP